MINQRYDDGFNHADAEMLTIFAAQAAIAIQNARLLAERQTSLTELTKLEQRKSQFIALVSHELRTPLNLISGYLSLLRSSLPGAVGAEHEVMEFLSHVDQATSTLTGMVNNITSLYNMSGDRQHPAFAGKARRDPDHQGCGGETQGLGAYEGDMLSL